MNDNDVFGVKLELIIDGFKKKINEVKNIINKSSEEIKDKAKIDLDSDSLSKEANEIKNKINEIKSELAEFQKNNISSDSFMYKDLVAQLTEYSNKLDEITGKNSVGEVSDEFEETENKVEKVNSSISRTKAIAQNLGTIIKKSVAGAFEKVKSTASNTSSKIKSAFSNIGKSISNSVKTMKKFTISLLGARAAYGAIRKAASAYLSQNESLNNQINGLWYSLGSLLAPVLQYIVNLASKVVGVINKMVTALTGVNLMAKKSTGSLKSTAAASKSLAGFDTITNLNSGSNDSGSSDSGVTDVDTSWADNLKLDAASISKTISDAFNGIAEKINGIDWAGIGQKISGFLTNIDFSAIFTSLTAVFGEAVLGLTTMMVNIDWATVLGNLSTGFVNSVLVLTDYIGQIPWADLGQQLSNSFMAIDWAGLGSSIINLIWEGLKGIATLFENIDWGGVATTISTAVDTWIDTIVENFENTDWDEMGKNIIDSIADFLGGIDYIKLATNIIRGLVIGLTSLGKLVVSACKEIFNKVLDWLGIHSPSTKAKSMGINLMKGLINGIKSLASTVVQKFKDIWNSIKNVFSSVGTFFGNIWNTVKSKLSEMGSKAGDAIGSAFKTVINGILSTVEKTLNTPIKAINSLLKVINKVPGINLGKLDELSLPRLATGTNYVPADMTAVIHKGEAVVPKKFNSKEYFDKNGNEETNALLRTLISAVQSKDTNVYMDSKKIGQSVTNYINSQSRIMGRSVV